MSFLRKKSEHQWVDGSLSAYIDGELSPAEMERVEDHLQECHACSESSMPRWASQSWTGRKLRSRT